MAYQDWLNRAASTNAVSNNIPPALIPVGNSVLNEQPVPSSYTSNQAQRNPGNTAISSQGQINQIMNSINPQTGTTNPFSIPFSGGGGGGPSTWGSYSSGGTTGPSDPSMGTGNPGVTQNYNTGGWNPDVSGGNWGGVDEMDQLSSWLSQQPWANPPGTPTGGSGQNVLGTGKNWGEFFGDLGISAGNAFFPGAGTLIGQLWGGASSSK